MWDQIVQVLNVKNWDLSGPDIGVLVGYLILMLLIGYVCRKISGNISDYIRMGAKGTWWLAGLSVFMQSFSAATFTGYCGQAFLAGWSVMLVFWGSALIFFVQAAFFAPWLRQTRAVTPPDAIRMRFGPVVEKIFVYISVPAGLCWSGTFLFTLATFFAAMFNLPMGGTLIVMAVIIVFYSVSGGSWSVQITDSIQSFILIPVTIVIAALCLVKLGDGNMLAGIGNMMQKISDQGLSDDFQLIKPDNFDYPEYIQKGLKPGVFTVMWIIGSLFQNMINAANMTTCYRYLSIKSGADARKAATLAGVLMLLGSFIWFIPPVTGRLLYQDEILGLNDTQVVQVSSEQAINSGQENNVEESTEEKPQLDSPADGAYAYVAKSVLPPGMLGLVLIAISSAAMSSMDSNLTGTAGIITKNMLPPVLRLIRINPPQGRSLLKLTKFVNLLLGCWALFMAFFFKKISGGEGVFSLMLDIVLFIAIPVSTPMVVAFFCKKIPYWSVLVGMACGWICSITMMIGPMEELWGWHKGVWFDKPMWHWGVFIQTGATVIPTVLTRFFWFTAKDDYRKRVDDFFKRINTPVDFEKEIGQEEDHTQMMTVGLFSLVTGILLSILIFFGEGLAERLAAVFVAGFVIGIGSLLYFSGRARRKKLIERGIISGEDEAIVPHAGSGEDPHDSI